MMVRERLVAQLPYLLIVLLAGLVVLACSLASRADASGSVSPSPSPSVTPVPPPPARQIVVGGAWWRYWRIWHTKAVNQRQRVNLLRAGFSLPPRAVVPRCPRTLLFEDWRVCSARWHRLVRSYDRELSRLKARLRDPVGIGRYLAAQRGWTGYQWTALYELWRYESGWRPLAHNPYSGAHGIPQALPGSKMSAYGADWYSNPRTQILWGLSYVSSRYGNPANALAHFHAYNWY